MAGHAPKLHAPRAANSIPASASSSPDTITSRDNKWLKSFRAVLQGTGPKEGEPLGVEGPKLIEEAVRAGRELDALLVSVTGECELARILDAAKNSDAGIARTRILRTTDKLFSSIAATETPQGVAALFHQPRWTFDDVLRGAPSPEGAFRGDAALVVVLTGVQDPGNVGTILRSAEAFGATGAAAARGTADPWSPKAIRASAGSAMRLPLLRGIAAPVLLAQLRMAQVKIFVASAHAPHDHTSASAPSKPPADLTQPCAIFIGSEGSGVAPEIERSSDAVFSIPMADSVDSLNAGVAASVVLYDAARQRSPL